ncbi:MAG: ATP-dependent helicase [Ignavibacteriales bacterium]|nr:ATP-dependent helicase [Ignavibacteriales bacterium]
MPKKYRLTKINKVESERKQFDESQFEIDYVNELNPAQYDAVTSTEGAYLVIAGAGTGKTRTLVYRVARLVEMGVDPKSILLLTFTRKSAKEMMNRAAILLDNRCSKINGGTFHSFANLTLRKYAKLVGLDSGFTILDQSDSEDVINLIRAQLDLVKLKKRFPNKQTIQSIISLSTNTGKKIEDIVAEEYPHFAEHIEKIIEISRFYTSYKKKSQLLDYDDLLIYLRDFLHDKAKSQVLLSSIKYVMIDEYQDTNKLQADIVFGLAGHNNNIMVVGDDSQSIYSFRGANFKNIMQFPKLFKDVKTIMLEENYRSTQEVLDFGNYIIDTAIEKYPKHLFTRKTGGELPAIISATTENMQSRFIVDRILELREENIPLNDIAVLFRSSFSSFDLEIELNKANIPYQKFGGMKFIETAHVKDVLAFLRIAENPNDVVSWYRVLLLHEGIGPKKAQDLLAKITAGELNIKAHPEKTLDKSYKTNIFNLFLCLYRIHTSRQLPTELTEIVLDYYEPLFKAKYDDFNKRKKDLDIFINITENYTNLTTLLADMALEPPTESMADISEEEKDNEYLTLSTIHSAKGLEWHSVFIIHAVEGFFPSSMSYNKIESLEEERRLMYVAATRAKNNLYISYPMNIFDRHNGMTLSKPSRFIAEISEELAEEWLLEEDF